MLSRIRAPAASASSLVVVFATLAWLTPAEADRIRTTTCVRSGGVSSCTTIWRTGVGSGTVLWTPRTEREAAEADERERLWLARCRPVAEHDQYGVKRYRYAAPGCEFGRYD
jgi:hypothetical protein